MGMVRSKGVILGLFKAVFVHSPEPAGNIIQKTTPEASSGIQEIEIEYILISFISIMQFFNENIFLIRQYVYTFHSRVYRSNNLQCYIAMSVSSRAHKTTSKILF